MREHAALKRVMWSWKRTILYSKRVISSQTRPLSPTFNEQSFKTLGLESNLIRSMRKAFPNIEKPTKVQETLIKEILGGRDIILKDSTGTGKSFGIILGLLNKPRVILEDQGADGQKILKHVITSLFIVPHKDLAYQLSDWIERMVRQLKPEPRLESIVQVLVRGSEKSHDKLIGELKETPPHILICTPQAFLEVYEKGREALGVGTLSTVVLDEVDYLVRTVVKDRKNSYWKAYEKAVRKIEKHPGPTREILDMIYERRKGLWEKREGVEDEKVAQLVMCSATVRVHLKDYLFRESGWLNRNKLVKITGGGEEKGKIVHSILVVSDTGVRNVDGAVERLSEESEIEGEAEEEAAGVKRDSAKETRESDKLAVALETVAAAFALDVPAVGLVVLGASGGVRRTVEELRAMGVNAEGLDMQRKQEAEGEPRLLVGTFATTRGLDLGASLTHVFVLGIPEGVDEYLHVSGRVGRFGREGSVISVVEEAEAEKMSRILGAIGEKPVQFKHFI